MSTQTADPTAPAAAVRTEGSPAARAALWVAAAALAAGVAADAFLRVNQWGVSLLLFALICCALSAAVSRWTRPEGAPRAWMAPVVGVAALCAWRDADPLKVLEVLCIALILAFAVLQAQGGSPRLARVGDYVMAFGRTVTAPLFGGMFFLADTRWSEVPRPGASRHAPAILRGLALTVPLAFVFGALLSSADAGFQRLVDGLFGWEMSEAFSHVLAILFFAWAALGILRALHLVRRGGQAAPLVPETVLTLGQTEIAMVLGMLDLMFLTFVILQVRWLFGGAEVVASSPTLGYAEYARRGFFELVTVAALALPLLLGLHWTLRSAGDRQVRVFRVLAGVMVALLFVMMASALRRMWLYQQALSPRRTCISEGSSPHFPTGSPTPRNFIAHAGAMYAYPPNSFLPSLFRSSANTVLGNGACTYITSPMTSGAPS